MKVVVDTNVIVSALLTPTGLCAQILGLLTEGILQPCVDERILAEYEEVLLDPRFPFEPAHVAALIEMLRRVGERVAALPIQAALPDEDDRPFLEVAATAQAVVVTGNLRHFPKAARKGVLVVSPREFLELLRRLA